MLTLQQEGYADLTNMKKQYGTVLLCAVFILAACAGQRSKVIFRPDPGEDRQLHPSNPLESWQIIETRNGSGDRGIPEWVRRFFENRIHGIESMDEYTGKYVFIGENWGENLFSLRQWADGFTEVYDLPRLVAARVERRLVSSASLYPDDEYGQYFETLIKKVADGEFSGAVKEQTYWVKRARPPGGNEEEGEEEPDQLNNAAELYEYLVLISIDTETLQGQLRQIMTGIKTTVPPTRDQAAAINRIQQAFFEGF